MFIELKKILLLSFFAIITIPALPNPSSDDESEEENTLSQHNKRQTHSKKIEKKSSKKRGVSQEPSFSSPVEPFTLDSSILKDGYTGKPPSLLPTLLQSNEIEDIAPLGHLLESIETHQVFNHASHLQNDLLNTMPFAISSLIFKYLNTVDQISLAKTCRRLNTHFKQLDTFHLCDVTITHQFFYTLSGRQPFLKQLVLSNLNEKEETLIPFPSDKANEKFLKLEHLEISDCDNLIEIQYQLINLIRKGTFPNLTRLDLPGLNLNKHLRPLMEAIAQVKIPKLSHLNVSNYKGYSPNDVDDIFILLCNAIARGNIPNLTHLNLSEFNLSIESSQALAFAFMSNSFKELSFLNLRSAKSCACMRVIASGLLPKLSFLNISGIDLNSDEQRLLIQAVQAGHLSNISDLDLSFCQLENETIDTLAYLMTPALLPKLTSLSLFKTSKTEEGFLPFLKAFEIGHMSNLTKLNITIGFDPSSFFRALITNRLPKLADLIICSNYTQNYNEGMDFSLESACLSSLTNLSITGYHNNKIWLKAIQSRSLLNIKCLRFDLSDDEEKTEFSKALKSGCLPNLTDLKSCYFFKSIHKVESVAEAIISGIIIHLSHLDLGLFSKEVFNPGLNLFIKAADSGNLSNLRSLSFGNHSLSQEQLLEWTQKIEAGLFPHLSFVYFRAGFYPKLHLSHFLKNNPRWKLVSSGFNAYKIIKR